MNWYDLVITGQPVHAGPTPMEDRRDPFMALHRIVDRMYALSREFAPWARVTFGDIRALPGSRNTVPEQLVVTLDMRHPDSEGLASMDRALRDIAREEGDLARVDCRVDDEWRSPAVKFDPGCVDAVRKAVVDLEYPYKEMVSGAGHDAVYVSRVAPTSMIFVPCEKGISHNEAENAKPEDIEAGCNVLLNTVVNLANS